MEEVNKELYWTTSNAFDLLSINEKTRFLNNMKDQMCKRGDVKLENEFLVVIPKEETHIIPIKYTRENHYATIILKASPLVKIDWENDKREKILITGEDSHTPAELMLHGKRCWIKQGELDKILSRNINIDNIKALTYREGVLSPYKTTGSIAKLIDGYELEFIWND